jgi:predicted nucleotidyltransferase component of viral defense system
VRQRQLKDVAASVRQRLLNRSHDTGRPFDELLRFYGMERFLYRLSVSPHAGKFVLKGGLMLVAWRSPWVRPTMDVDLLGRMPNDLAAVAAVVREVCLQDVEGDGLVFYVDSVVAETITADREYAGVRVKFDAELAKAAIPMQVDVGFGDVIVPGDQQIEFPSLLDFPAAVLRGYTRESVVAEKLEAMVKRGSITSRMSDFYDIWLLSRQYEFEGAVLAEAIMRTFADRGTEIVASPVTLSDEFARNETKQAQWRAFYTKGRVEHAPREFAEVVGEIASFLVPVLEAVLASKRLDATWTPPGPWLVRP